MVHPSPTTTTARDLTLAHDIAGWLEEQRQAAGAERFLLGLSGGIDSALVCALCAMAGGADRVLAAIMPSHSNPTDAEHAALVARTFGVGTVTVDLSPVADAFLAAMADAFPGQNTPAQLATANVRPRLRMTTLYYLANLRAGIVVGTGNKSEAMIGYFTKYGDGGVDLLPLVDLYKHEVRALARAVGVPKPVIAKPPSAGLWDGQTDEAEIGLGYDRLDAALAALDGSDAIEPAVAERVAHLVASSEHKRRPVPAFRQSPAASPHHD